MLRKHQDRTGAFWPRKKAIPFLVILIMLVGAAAALTTRAPVMAADADTYSWSNATYVDANYDWGYSTCPGNDTGCMRLYGYKNGIKYGESDPWGYYLRNCTSYVAEKINQEFNGRNISGWGNAASWASSAQKARYSLDSSPQVGDIAVWGTEVAHGYGHVAYVYAVSNGVATLDEYNVAGTGQFSSNRTTTSGSAGHPDWYIHMGTPGGTGWNGVGNATFSGADRLTTGQILSANQYLVSNNVQYALILQNDGNLVLYNGNSALWSSGTSGKGASYLAMQADGNLVLYTSSGNPVWASNTAGKGGSFAVMQDDGNFVTYINGGPPTWASNTGGRPTSSYFGVDELASSQTMYAGYYLRSSDKRYAALMQTDGNLVLYGPGYHVLWASNPNSPGANFVAMQGDGNLVEYTTAGKAVWASNTAGNGNSNVYIQSDGNLVIYRTSDGHPTWASGTNGKI